eukprot:1180235-Prorocentrum_minimum.AAC.4
MLSRIALFTFIFTSRPFIRTASAKKIRMCQCRTPKTAIGEIHVHRDITAGNMSEFAHFEHENCKVYPYRRSSPVLLAAYYYQRCFGRIDFPCRT